MRKLSIPSDLPEEVFRLCISRIEDEELKARLTTVESDVVTAADAYRIAASTGALHALPIQDDIRGIVSKKEMADVYKLRMVPKRSPGRPIYDKLMSAPAYGRCPLCGQRDVSTLDHHLPKTCFPALSVVPINLVPACSDCNKAKREKVPDVAGEQTLHPYFDDIEGDEWLRAELVQVLGPALRFFVYPPTEWDSIKVSRVRYHFKMFKLDELYASYAAEEFVSIRDSLRKLLSQNDVAGIKRHLQDQAESREVVQLNSWQTAMYKALASSDWFCQGGFDC